MHALSVLPVHGAQTHRPASCPPAGPCELYVTSALSQSYTPSPLNNEILLPSGHSCASLVRSVSTVVFVVTLLSGHVQLPTKRSDDSPFSSRLVPTRRPTSASPRPHTHAHILPSPPPPPTHTKHVITYTASVPLVLTTSRSLCVLWQPACALAVCDSQALYHVSLLDLCALTTRDPPPHQPYPTRSAGTTRDRVAALHGVPGARAVAA